MAGIQGGADAHHSAAWPLVLHDGRALRLRWRWPRRYPAESWRVGGRVQRTRSRPGGLPQAVLHLTRPRWCSARRQSRPPRRPRRTTTPRQCTWSRPHHEYHSRVWASTRRRARTLSSTKRARRCTAPTRRRIAPSSSFGDPGAGPGPMASGGFSGSRRSRRPRLGAHGASRRVPQETASTPRQSRRIPRWRPARLPSRTAPRREKK